MLIVITSIEDMLSFLKKKNKEKDKKTLNSPTIGSDILTDILPSNGNSLPFEAKGEITAPSLQPNPVSTSTTEPLKTHKVSDKTNSSPFIRVMQRILNKDLHRKELLEFCGQKSVVSFEEVFDQSLYRNVIRFDCGSYAELFSGIDCETNESIVLKVIRAVSDELMAKAEGPAFRSIGTFAHIYSEFRISEALSRLSSIRDDFRTHCFPQIQNQFLVEGFIPEHFLTVKPCDQITPIRDDVFEDFVSIPREYAVLVMSFGGQPIWKCIKNNCINGLQLISVIKQITIGLAIAEKVLEFEHRDLHISNILVKKTTKPEIEFIYDNHSYYIDSEGFEATIIDTTFSRITSDDRIFSTDLSPVMTFSGQLSAQDKAYKSMVEMTQNNWKSFTPKSNIIWLTYICREFCKVLSKSEDIENKKQIEKILTLFDGKNSLQEFDFNLL